MTRVKKSHKFESRNWSGWCGCQKVLKGWVEAGVLLLGQAERFSVETVDGILTAA